jgi:hypothetical protein
MSAQAAVAKVREGLAELRDVALWALSDAESRELVADLFGVSASVQSQYLGQVPGSGVGVRDPMVGFRR